MCNPLLASFAETDGLSQYQPQGSVWLAEDGLATEDDEDDTDLPPAEMHAEPASTAQAAEQAAQVAGAVRQAELRERSRLEEDAIGEQISPL